MRDALLTVLLNESIAPSVYRMVLSGITAEDGIRPGQFVNFRLAGKYLRRPISVNDYTETTLTVIYKAVGEGTRQMAKMQAGETLPTLLPLGNGYDPEKAGEAPLLIGGGVGIPPLYALCKALLAKGAHPTVILGFNTAAERFCEEEFAALGARVLVTTVDGSYGIPGFVTDAFAEAGKYSYFYTCGPEPMLRAVYAKTETSGQFSFEERMGCGFGACMGCSCKTIAGYKRICKDGPVLEKEEILWQA